MDVATPEADFEDIKEIVEAAGFTANLLKPIEMAGTNLSEPSVSIHYPDGSYHPISVQICESGGYLLMECEGDEDEALYTTSFYSTRESVKAALEVWLRAPA